MGACLPSLEPALRILNPGAKYRPAELMEIPRRTGAAASAELPPQSDAALSVIPCWPAIGVRERMRRV